MAIQSAIADTAPIPVDRPFLSHTKLRVLVRGFLTCRKKQLFKKPQPQPQPWR